MRRCFCLSLLSNGAFGFGLSSVSIVLHHTSKLWQVFECLRRLLLTSVLVFVPDKSGQAAAYGCIFAFLRYRVKKPSRRACCGANILRVSGWLPMAESLIAAMVVGFTRVYYDCQR